MRWLKHLILSLQHQHPIWVTVHVQAVPLPIGLPANGLGKQWRMVQNLKTLYPLGRLRKKLMVPGFREVQLHPFGEWTNRSKNLCHLLCKSSFQIKIDKSFKKKWKHAQLEYHNSSRGWALNFNFLLTLCKQVMAQAFVAVFAMWDLNWVPGSCLLPSIWELAKSMEDLCVYFSN